MDLTTFMGKAFPLGAVITSAVYQGDLLVAEDGSEWIAGTQTAAFAYSSAYASCPSSMKVPHTILDGPRNGMWTMNFAGQTLAYKASSTLMCTGGVAGTSPGDATNGYYYYTSTDGGASWTQRTFPNSKMYEVVYTAGKFIGVALSSTTNGIITSTDAITWTNVTGISIASVADIVSDGGSNICIVPSNGTAGASSTNGGTSFSASTYIATPNLVSPGGCGIVSWNAGAGLFICSGSAAAGGYSTSPTGAVWTARASQSTYLPYQFYFGQSSSPKFASNATTTIAVGTNGFFATTTDGLTWANHGFIGTVASGTPQAVYYDGTRFVVIANDGKVFYSTNGTTWVAGPSFPGSGLIIVGNGRAYRMPSTTQASYGKALLMADASETTPATIAPPTTSTPAQVISYYRIK